MIAVLGIILIYSILISNVEEKTYEYGMIRALGLEKSSLVQVILIYSLYFAIPGIIVGMILAYLVSILVNYIFQIIAALPTLNLLMYWVAVVLPIALGLIIPIAANVIPIRVSSTCIPD